QRQELHVLVRAVAGQPVLLAFGCDPIGPLRQDDVPHADRGGELPRDLDVVGRVGGVGGDGDRGVREPARLGHLQQDGGGGVAAAQEDGNRRLGGIERATDRGRERVSEGVDRRRT